MNKRLTMICLTTFFACSGIFTANHAIADCPGDPPRIRVPGSKPWIIPSNTVFEKGRNYWSQDYTLFLTFQKDTNLVLYKQISCHPKKFKAIWNTRTAGLLAKAVFQKDGNLVLYKPDGVANYWNSIAEVKKRNKKWTDSLPPYEIDSQTYTTQFGPAILVIQNDNNLVIYDTGNGRPLWDSRTAAH
ncbi:hypothetical protein ACFQ2T_11680 [Methylophilus flavus]|jgi:hypothetical protein|uniref:Bulb-type lectin domain-containing protein n=1 Tax=Methylophilus flavus TaxID=640084 RepID=A0ABW3PA06_9PROT